jgi:ribosomal protein S18 acetylase RimI-like enzyme
MENLIIEFVDQYHLGEATSIEAKCFETPLATQEFMSMFKAPKNLMLGAFSDKRLLGFLLYAREHDHSPTAEILRIAVLQNWRRQGIATALVRYLAALGPADERKVVARVNEIDLDSQLFLRSLSFKVQKIEHKYYKDSKNDAYLMEHACERRQCESAGGLAEQS